MVFFNLKNKLNFKIYKNININKFNNILLFGRATKRTHKIHFSINVSILQGRNIQHCIAGASECLNMLHSRSQAGGSRALKIDIKKAFDSMKWSFLDDRFGFDDRFCRWVNSILESTQISILLNGLAKGYFRCEHGVRHGILYLHYCFTLVMTF